jgi:tellurite resistance protein TehA-like permease
MRPTAGKEALAIAVWSLNVALFCTFLCLLLSRALCYPGSARELLEQPNQSLFFGALPMSISVITGGVATLLVLRWVLQLYWAGNLVCNQRCSCMFVCISVITGGVATLLAPRWVLQQERGGNLVCNQRCSCILVCLYASA